MPIIDLPTHWVIILDFVAWGILQPAAAWLCTMLPSAVFCPARWLFRTRRWERDGTVYDRFLAVRRWKGLLPSGGTVRRGGFDMRHVTSHAPDYLRTWVLESCRAELVHWLAIPPALLFFLWNPWYVGLLMIPYPQRHFRKARVAGSPGGDVAREHGEGLTTRRRSLERNQHGLPTGTLLWRAGARCQECPWTDSNRRRRV